MKPYKRYGNLEAEIKSKMFAITARIVGMEDDEETTFEVKSPSTDAYLTSPPLPLRPIPRITRHHLQEGSTRAAQDPCFLSCTARGTSLSFY